MVNNQFNFNKYGEKPVSSYLTRIQTMSLYDDKTHMTELELRINHIETLDSWI